MNSEILELLPLGRRSALQNIRNFLAGRFVGATRDRALMDELFKCLFAKHWLEKLKIKPTKVDLSKEYRRAFAAFKNEIPDVFIEGVEIELDPVGLAYIDQQLSSIDFEAARADIYSEVYEVFGTSGIKSSEGQFFTPVVAVDFLVGLVKPEAGKTVSDPACGAGGFLVSVAKRWLSEGVNPKKALRGLVGIDKDDYLARMSRGRLALLLDGSPQIHCADSLAGLTKGDKKFEIAEVDYVLTNPPFGSKIVAGDHQTLAGYELARRWTKDDNGGYLVNGSLATAPSPQILFLELCLRMLKPGGYLGAVLPESLVSSKSYAHVVHYLKSKADLVAVVGMPEALFKTSGKSGTHTKTVALVAQKRPHAIKRSWVFFAEAKWCGHDSRGRSVPKNDVPQIAENFDAFSRSAKASYGSYGVAVSADKLGLNLAPRSFEFDINAETKRLSKNHNIRRFGDLVEAGVLSLSTGDEVGKLAYGTGDIPFVRTSDISNWEIKVDPKHRVSKEVWEKYNKRQDVRAGDILMVRDGTYLIGTCAIMSDSDLPMLYQSHIYKIRVIKSKEIAPYLLLAALSCPFVQRQIKSHCVSQDIIDSLGDKIYELQIPVPISKEKCRQIGNTVRKAIKTRIEARELSRQAVTEIISD